MDPSHIGILIVCLFLILLSAFMSAAEMAYSTANKVRLRSFEVDGNKKATKVLKLLDQYDKLLSSILVGNNAVNITLASLSTVLFTQMLKANADIAVTVSTIVVTVVTIIFGEITPKSIARDKPESFCLMFNGLVKGLFVILTPFNELFMLWKKLLKKVFKLERNSFVTGDELKSYVETAKNDGEISSDESELIRSAIEFDDLDVYDIMTPRVNVVAIEENESHEEIFDKFYEHGYSRMPVYSKNIDNVLGILHEKDFYYLSKRGNIRIKDVLRHNIVVSKTMKISAALKLMQKEKVHMAVVVDEFGGTAGIVTVEDIIEELVGEIWDEHDEVEILTKKIDDDSFIVSGSENLEDMFEQLGLDVKEEFDSITVGGWVMEQLGRIPTENESLEFNGLKITVTKATVSRIDEVKVTVLKVQED